MKRIVLLIVAVLLIVTCFAGCTQEVPLTESYKAKYVEFLKAYKTESKVCTYALRDFDNNEIPELIIINSTGYALKTVVSIYSYNGEVYKMGDYSNPSGSSANGFRFSTNPKYPGLFELYWGYDVDHFGYISIKDGKVSYEPLWNNYKALDPVFYEKLSDNAELIKEAESIYADIKSENAAPINQLVTYNLSEQNFEVVINAYTK